MSTNWRSGAVLIAAVLMPLMSAGCATTGPAPVPLARSLPPAEVVVPAPAPRPAIRKGMDVRVLARQALDYGDANAERLGQARSNYQRVVKGLAGPPAK